MSTVRTSRGVRFGPAPVLLGVLALTVVTLVAALGMTGGRALDLSPVVRWGLPVARVVHDLAAALTVGLLALSAWAVGSARPAGRHRSDGNGELAGVRRTMARYAAIAAVTWFGAALVVLVLTTSEIADVPLTTPGFGAIVVFTATQLDLGRALGASLVLVAVVANLAILATRVTTIVFAAVFSLLAVLPLALAGHAAGTQDHTNAVDSLALHLLGVTLWAGGLGALLLVARRLGDQLVTVARRYSTLAGWCFVVVAVSGVINAALRVDTLANLTTPYGLLVVGKTLALVLLGVAGWIHRRVTLVQMAANRTVFVRLALVELLVMGATMGLGVALSRSAPPEAAEAFDPATILLGYPAPPPITVGRYFSVVYPETLWLSVALVMTGLYLAGVLRLRRRGDSWPVGRSLFWLAGCLTLVFVTSGGPAVYGRIHFSAHMIQHMTLMIIVPMLLVFGAPVTLAMRTLVARSDGSFGPREMLLAMVHSRFLQVLGNPVVAVALFTVGLVVFYYTQLFELAMFTHTGHVLMTAHFLLAGYLFVWSLVGIDPGPARPAYPFRLLLLLLMLAFHAFFGISLMSSGTLLAPDWWHALGQTDDAVLIEDQQTGGAIAWAAGDLPSLLLGLALLVGWFRSDARETKQSDRRSDRDGDAELRRYNEQLSAMSRRKPPA